MAKKRLSDAEKWDDPWFSGLPNIHKLVWLFILDKCDYAGIWKVNQKAINFALETEIDLGDFLASSKGRIVVISPEKWFVPKFLEFQYGYYREACNAHKPVLSVLKKYGLESFFIPSLSLPGREQEQRQEQVKEDIVFKELFNQIEEFEKIWSEYPVKGRLKRSASLRIFCETVLSRDTVSRILRSLKNYSANLKANPWKQTQELPNWLQSWPDWEHHEEPKNPDQEREDLERRLSR